MKSLHCTGSARCVRLTWSLLLLIVSAGARAGTPPEAAVASAHPLATQAGLSVMEQGGDAFDAAVTVAAALAVVEPYSSGLGGGGFFLLHRARDGREVMIDARETAPQRAHRDLYLDDRGEVIPKASLDGALAAAIPGMPAALEHLAMRYGRLPLAQTLQPAVALARGGFEVDERYRRMAGWRLEPLKAFPDASRIFLRDGDVPSKGTRIVQLDLAETLTRISRKGAAGFYRGELAQRLVKGVQAAGGIWTLEDLAQYRVIEREPVRGRFRGYELVTAAPPSSGGVAMMTVLHVLAAAGGDANTPVQRTHLLIEAMRRAYRDRAEYLGDPDFVSIPTARLLSPDYAAGLHNSIRMDRATPSAQLRPAASDVPGGSHTTHFSILDIEGNRVAATLTINYGFGSGFVPPGTGVLLNDEMDDFSARPGTPNAYGLVGAAANAIASGKRPLSSMTPTFVEGERGVLIVGTPGGSRIISMVLGAVLDFIDGADAETIVSRARIHHQYLPDEAQFESGAFRPDQQRQLERLGHTLRQVDSYGNMQAVFWDRVRDTVHAASDPRGSR